MLLRRALWCLSVFVLAAAGAIQRANEPTSQRAIEPRDALQGPQVLVPSAEGMPDGPGKDVTVKACGTCHETRRAASVRLTREGWAAVIDSMTKRGARISDEEFPIVLDYLSTHFLGEAPQPLNVNTAAQIDLESAGGLLRREAAAVIQYRDKHGRFKTLDDLKKVPGLDFKKIESRRDFMTVGIS